MVSHNTAVPMPMMPVYLSLLAGMISVGAAFVFYACWRISPAPRYGWWVATALFATISSLASPRVGLVDPASVASEEAIDLLVALGVLALLLVSRRAQWVPDPLWLGLGLGVAGASARLGINSLPEPNLSTTTVGLVAAGVVLAHLAFLFILLRLPLAQGWVPWQVISILLLVIVTDFATSPLVSWSWKSWLASACGLIGAMLFLTVCLKILRTLMTSHVEYQVEARLGKERLHEIRSTVAGIQHASQILRDPTIAHETQERLSSIMRSELARLERLMDRHEPGASVLFDLDATIDPLLEIHRARGRQITWQPSGTTAHGRPDDIAEVLNILLDNSAAHARDTESRIDVVVDGADVAIRVTDTGPGIAPEVRDGLFDWGVHCRTSPGQGIGLNVGRRLLVEQGGSLTLADDSTTGASFVIRLPATGMSG